MSEGMKAIAYALITLFLGVILRELGFKGARLVTLLGTVGAVGIAAVYVGRLSTVLGEMGATSSEYAVAMLKIVGLGYVFGICADICTELGDATLGSSVSLIGRLEIMVISLPYVRMIVEKGIGMI